MMTPEQAAVADLKQQGFKSKEIARKLGISTSNVNKRWSRAQKWLDLPDGVQSALQDTGIDPSHAKFGYRRIENDDGSFNTVFWRMPEGDVQDATDRVREALDGLDRVSPIDPPKDVLRDLMTLYVVSDLHSGMKSWAKETGENYDTRLAQSRLREWVGRCITGSPKSETAVILYNGDTLHANDQTNATPKSKHILDVDTRFFKTVDETIVGIAATIDLALHHHEKVELVIKPGNHDPTSYLALLFALDQRYRDEPRVNVEKEPSEFWVYQFGQVMLASHHGDKAKAQQLVMMFAAVYPDMWGQTEFRYVWTGHLHHLKQQEFPGMVWEQARAVSTRDAYAVTHGFVSKAEIQGVTYHKDKGEVSRVRVAA